MSTARGFHTTVDSPKGDKVALFKHDERTYDHVLLLPAKSKGLGPSLTANNLLEFVKKDGNVLVALSSEQTTPTAIQALLLELDISIPTTKGAAVVDHFNYDSTSAAEKHDVLLLPYPNALRAGVKNYFGGEGYIAVPRAVGQVLGNDSPMLSPILRAPSTAYSYDSKDEAEAVEEAARYRVLAMRLSDEWVAAGCDRADERLAAEREALVASYRALLAAVR